jgi:phosphatidate cytidylyltransferase
MTELDPARPRRTPGLGGGGLVLRVASALILAPLAFGIAYLGGWPFEVFWSVAALIVFWEWTSLVADVDRRPVLVVGMASIVLALLLVGGSVNAGEDLRELRLLAALIVLALGALVVGAFAAADRRAWVAAGIPYAAAIAMAPVVLRFDGEHGFFAIVYLFAVVWGTDVTAYFVGRAAGGPKLAPRWSPNKTWSGAIGGVIGAAIAAIAVAMTAGLGNLIVLTLIAVVLSLIAQAGDLFESALKRRFGAKDSGHLIPGHGGVMDRLDGFVAAAALACVLGLVHGGIEAPARGLLVW